MANVDQGSAWSRPLARPQRPAAGGRHLSDAAFGAVVILPALFVLVAVFLYPLGFSVYQSVRDLDLARPAAAGFVGLGNYGELLRSGEFHRALRNTLVYAGVAVPVEFVGGLALAVALSQVTRGRGVIRMLLIVPMMLAPIVMGLMWKFMYNDQFGVINFLVRGLGLAERPPLWLSDPNIALFSVIAVDVWATTPVVILLLLAGLLSIPGDLYEAAKIDGGGALSNFVNITLPLLKPAILVTLLLRGMDAFRVFDIVYVMTKGGPAFKTDVLSFLAYRLAFTDRSIGEAAALAWIMTAILAGAGLVLIGLLRRQGEAA